MKSALRVLVLVCSLLPVIAVHAANRQDEANKKLVQAFLKDIRKATFIDKDPVEVRAVVEKYMSPDYVQHSDRMPPGRDGYIQGMTKMTVSVPANIPPGEPDNRYWVSDAGLVVWVTVVPPAANEADPAGSKESYRFNMIRVDHGKLMEHWDQATQALPGASRNATSPTR